MEDIKRQQTSNKETLSRKVKVKPERPLARSDSSATNLKSEKLMFNSHLMEAVCNRNNLQLALK